MSIGIVQVDPKNRTESGCHRELVKNAICKHISLLNQQNLGCCCDVSESSNQDCSASSECSDIDNSYVDNEKKIRSFKNSNGELLEKICNKHQLTENPLRSCKNSNGELVENISNKDQLTDKCGVPKLVHDYSGSEESGNECVEDNKKDVKLLANSYGDLQKDAHKDKATENSVFISGSNTASNFDTIRKICRNRFEHLNKLRKKPRFRVAFFLCSVSFNILLIILIYFAAISKKKEQLPGHVGSTVPSVICDKGEFKSVACWSCSLGETFKSSGKAIQKYIHNGEIVCCVKQVPYVQSLAEVMNNEYHRMKQTSKRIAKRQTKADVPVAIHVELSQKVSKDGSLNWKTPSDWRSSTNVVGTISQAKGVFKIPLDGLYTLYESLITRFKNSSLNKKDEYIHVRIHKNSGRTTNKVLIQRNLKRWTGLQVYQGASSMASFYLQKGDDVELFLSDSDLILYKSQGINHFGIYKH